MNSTSLRWTLGGLIGLASVTQALRALGSLAGRGVSLGFIALASLAALTVLGMLSLWKARRRIARELDGLSQRPPTGDLIEERRARLARIAASGARPDRDALAESSVANERGQAYLGRYLVAVAVLIGLVGTFSGLAEALRGLPAILGGAAVDPQKLSSMLSAPLAGLDITFAAGIVGILSTLALALVQGDLQIAEELALARLEEETTHELIPTLWPIAQSVEERTAREIASLRADNRALLAEAGSAIGQQVAEVSARQGRELADRLATAVEQSTRRLADDLARGLTESLRAQVDVARAIREEGAAQIAVLEKRATLMVEAASRSTASLEKRFIDESGALRDSMRASLDAQLAFADDLRLRTDENAAQLGSQLGALHAQLGAHAEATQTALVTQATRASDEATRAWRETRDALVGELSATRASLTTSIDGVRTALAIDATEARLALETASRDVVATLGRIASESALALTDGHQASLAALSRDLKDASQSLSTTLEQTSRTVAQHSERTLAALADSTTRAVDAMSTSTATSVASLTESMEQANAVLIASAEQVARSLDTSAERAQIALTDGAGALLSASTTELAATRIAIAEAATSAGSSLADVLAESRTHMESLLTSSRTELESTLAANRDAVDRLVTDSIGALGATVNTLAESNEMLARTSDALAPQLEALAPELRALTQEVALLGSRSEPEDEPLFADELVRLGEGMSRLEALVRMSNGRTESAQS